MPSVIALLERREARAQQELDAWLERLREVQEQVTSCQERLECARIGRVEVLRALAEEGEAAAAAGAVEAEECVAPPGPQGCPSAEPVSDVVAGVPDGSAVTPGLPAGRDSRPPVWRAGLGPEALAGQYRQLFEVVAARRGPVSVRELAVAVGRDAARLNEVEKVRHRAYALQARGWFVRVPGGLFTPAAGPGGAAGTRASAAAGAPSSG
ncbi:hypothetical protein [Peterkaempfera sp. SMS 1(5)a]|uniref:hypothetical protein n=1 Tax=Peterkaempfera podocarpi TaxID=3232308 RepID=UPI00366E4CE3